ncbi:MAG: radical SAM protein, partial [Flammeovirgaceae bacterium]|nr:radical SAM protein [Flammeovirgaceae bacterium]MDW8288732.1 radical SAM protein [Flammeovirgaceae bacterium]
MNVLLVIPPLTQLNTPYPSTAYLKGFLKKNGIVAHQADLGIELVLRIFCSDGLRKMFDEIESFFLKHPEKRKNLESDFLRMVKLRKNYERIIDAVIAFLQHQDPTLAHRICQGGYLPEGRRFRQLED